MITRGGGGYPPLLATRECEQADAPVKERLRFDFFLAVWCVRDTSTTRWHGKVESRLVEPSSGSVSATRKLHPWGPRAGAVGIHTGCRSDSRPGERKTQRGAGVCTQPRSKQGAFLKATVRTDTQEYVPCRPHSVATVSKTG